MGLLGKIFTWWDGATIGTTLHSWRHGELMGEDSLGNRYYRGRRDGRRWVIYAGSNDASRVPAEWHGWLHGTLDDVPERALPPVREWQAAPAANLTGTASAYLPAGALDRGAQRARSAGDYGAWTPEEA